MSCDSTQHSAFFSKLLDYLNLEPFGDVPPANADSPAPLQKMVGLENVQSHTKTMSMPAKEAAVLRLTGAVAAVAPDAQVDSEIQRWMQGRQPPAGRKQQLEEPEKKDMRVKTQLVHVGVKEFSSRGKDRHFGYIITGSE